MSHNARRLGEVAEWAQQDPNCLKQSKGAEDFWFTHLPPFR